MRHHINRVVKSATFQQSIITTISTFLASGLGAVFYLILARLLGPAEYGRFSIALSILLGISSVADLGMGSSLVRFVGSNKEDNKYFPYAKIALITKLITSFVTIIFLFFGSKFIAENLLKQPSITNLLPVVGFGVAAFVLFSFLTSVFQGLQQYIAWGIIQVGANLLRLVVALILLFFGILNAKTSIIALFSTLLIGFLIGWKWLPKSLLSFKLSKKYWHEFWQFNRWTAGITIIATLASRADTILASRYLSISEVGVYSLGGVMISFMPQLLSAIGAVTSSKFAGISKSDIGVYLKKTVLFSTVIAVVGSLALIPAAKIVIWISGSGYAKSFEPFLILLLGISIFMISAPTRDAILYGYKKPQFFFWLSIIHAATIWFSGTYLIVHFGASGIAWSTVIAHGFSLIIICIYYNHLKK